MGGSSTWERSFENQPRHEGMDSWSDCCIPAFACFLLGRLTCLDLKQKANQNKKTEWLSLPAVMAFCFSEVSSVALTSGFKGRGCGRGRGRGGVVLVMSVMLSGCLGFPPLCISSSIFLLSQLSPDPGCCGCLWGISLLHY